MLAALQHDGRHEARLNAPVLGLRRVEHGVLLQMAHGTEQFDAVVLACHSDQALRLLGLDATPQERSVLGAIRYQPNQAVLHTDASVLPSRKAAWAAWNYERAADAGAIRPASACTI
jgi:predicted NAD/FAD-binding protein